MFAEDDEGKALLAIGREVQEAYSQYEDQYIAITKQIFEMGQTQYTIRKTEVDQFFESINTAKKNSQTKSIVRIKSN